MANPLKLPYGLRGEQLLHVADVANGLSCACVCPGCGARLVARNQGKVKVAHFAHYQAPECAGGLQTALHLAAKEIFLHHSTFLLPGIAVEVGFHAEHFEGEDYYESFGFDAWRYQGAVKNELHPTHEYTVAPRPVTIRQVLLERRTADIVPDLILETDRGTLLVEIAVTHFVDEVKLAKIQRLGISCVEIDLSHYGRDLAGPALAELLLHQPDHKRWVHNAPLSAKLAALHADYLARARPLFAEYHAEVLRERDRRALAQAQDATREQAKRQLYADSQRAITVRPDPRPPHSVEGQVLSCPDPRRGYAEQTYANAATDCTRCSHFRGYSGPHGAAVVCLHDHHQREKIDPARLYSPVAMVKRWS